MCKYYFIVSESMNTLHRLLVKHFKIVNVLTMNCVSCPNAIYALWHIFIFSNLDTLGHNNKQP